MESYGSDIGSKKDQKVVLVPQNYTNSDMIPVGHVVHPAPVSSQNVYYPNPIPTNFPNQNIQFVAAQPVEVVKAEENKDSPRTAALRENIPNLELNQGLQIESRSPVIIKCQHCNMTGISTIRKQNGCVVYASSAFCCVFGFAPCAIAPWFIKEFKDIVHECHFCGNVVATVKRHDRL
mmetsp:Transcript_5046/g.5738  ORF Transcript_5046/g.5738 Transcript_5046/m.5738 type:complete len:178 (+) Transcript_5046:36-569(+)|eukprot:CAMPEP_0205799106 /NCGR_PEP_ID=MMETSP0205-20121125/246_1 /ASSEMBLY_ACC=CAM_ASM_000278 /TAXON_ID=36767 /ORGANISM="Euplotes focardii, Strain TN1" /LENGTH=177 /DNA_ID=CAMNT_0053059825 /DNA_START=14 /DNA_END=547 /DNA_ORIENTATION=-